MKRIYLYFAIVFSLPIFSQIKDSIYEISFKENKEEINVNRLTENDTVYLLFNHKKHQDFGISLKKKEKIITYTYIYHFNEKFNNQITISIRTDSILNSDRKKASFKLIDKKFIRKNRKNVFTIKEMRKKGAKNTVDEIGFCTIYLIDTKIKENRKYKAREVKIYYPAEL